MTDPRAAAFYQHVHKSDECWHWTRTLHGAYGTFKGPGDTKYVNSHRYAWDLAGRSALAANQQLITDCGTRGCVRPEHQKVVLRGSHLGKARRGQP